MIQERKTKMEDWKLIAKVKLLHKIGIQKKWSFLIIISVNCFTEAKCGVADSSKRQVQIKNTVDSIGTELEAEAVKLNAQIDKYVEAQWVLF